LDNIAQKKKSNDKKYAAPAAPLATVLTYRTNAKRKKKAAKRSSLKAIQSTASVRAGWQANKSPAS